jgi:hypothetical protein
LGKPHGSYGRVSRRLCIELVILRGSLNLTPSMKKASVGEKMTRLPPLSARMRTLLIELESLPRTP